MCNLSQKSIYISLFYSYRRPNLSDLQDDPTVNLQKVT